MIIPSMEEETPVLEISMASSKAGKIIRISVHTFLKEYQYFTSIAAILALPFSLSLLLSQALFLFPSTIFFSLFPSSSFHGGFFSIVALKLSQTFSSSIITLPFALSFLLFSKAAAIHHFKGFFEGISVKFNGNCPLLEKPLWKVYKVLLSTHLWNSFMVFSVNAVFLAFSFLVEVGTTAPMYKFAVSAIGAVVYSIALANATVVSTVALAHAGLVGTAPGGGGLRAILSTYNIIKRNNNITTTLILAVPSNLGLAAIEALFHFRIISAFPQENYDGDDFSKELWLLALEAVLIGYLYSIILVLDVIISCFFYQSCCDDKGGDCEEKDEEDHEHYYYYNLDKLKGLEEHPV